MLGEKLNRGRFTFVHGITLGDSACDQIPRSSTSGSRTVYGKLGSEVVRIEPADGSGVRWSRIAVDDSRALRDYRVAFSLRERVDSEPVR